SFGDGQSTQTAESIWHSKPATPEPPGSSPLKVKTAELASTSAAGRPVIWVSGAPESSTYTTGAEQSDGPLPDVAAVARILVVELSATGTGAPVSNCVAVAVASGAPEQSPLA